MVDFSDSWTHFTEGSLDKGRPLSMITGFDFPGTTTRAVVLGGMVTSMTRFPSCLRQLLMIVPKGD